MLDVGIQVNRAVIEGQCLFLGCIPFEGWNKQGRGDDPIIAELSTATPSKPRQGSENSSATLLCTSSAPGSTLNPRNPAPPEF